MSKHQTFTGTVEAMHADELRATRDRSDADIRAGFIQRIDETRIARERARDAATRGRWEREAAVAAVHSALNRASYAATQQFPSLDFDDETIGIEALDLEGATITVTITDLVATATVTVPTLPKKD